MQPDDSEPHDVDASTADDPPRSRRQPIHRRSSDRGRATRFVEAYGWRAYAVPILAIATVIALIGVLEPHSSEANDTNAGATTAQSAAGTSAQATSGAAAETTAPPTPTEAQPTPDHAQVGDGNLNVVPGATGMVYGTGGALVTYDVEVEGGITIDQTAFALEVERILGDPRSWIATGEFTLQRVDTDQAALHITLVTPEHVEGYCPGYQTGGFTSCRYGDQVVINLARWSVGVDDYSGFLSEYREYVVNHEVGHYFGHHHVPCPAAGQKAPVMQQQTLGLDGCVINAWPYPNGPADDVNAPV